MTETLLEINCQIVSYYDIEGRPRISGGTAAPEMPNGKTMIRGFEGDRRVALIISECQQGVVGAGHSPFPGLVEQVAERGILPRIARLADAFRAAGQPVLHAHVVHRPDYADVPRTSVIIVQSVKHGRMRFGSVDVEPVPETAPQPGDIVHARGFSLVAFHGTDLDSILRNMGVQTLVLAGVSTNVAIPGMALCASDLGYQVVVPEDCVAGASEEAHRYAVGNLLPLYATLSSGQEVSDALAGRIKKTN